MTTQPLIRNCKPICRAVNQRIGVSRHRWQRTTAKCSAYKDQCCSPTPPTTVYDQQNSPSRPIRPHTRHKINAK